MRRNIWLLVFIFVLSCLSAADQSPAKTDTVEESVWETQLSKYSRIYAAIKEHYPGKLNKEKLFFASIDGFLRRLDPHSYFLEPVEMRSMNEDQQGNYHGIGTRITKYEDRLTVILPLKDTPAHRMGIRAGDVITRIDGKNTKDMSMDDAMKYLRGAKDTYVDIEIKRDGLEKPIQFHIKREEISLETVSYGVVHPEDPRVAFISIRTFGNTTADEFDKKLKGLVRKHKVESVIVDLRGNSGGALNAAVDISDFFLPRGKVIVSIKGRQMKQNYIAAKDGQYENMPVVVLINRASASASEIVASALQDHKKATIIGTRSWGKGLVQTVHKLELNSSLALTTARYYTPNNKCLQRDYHKLDDYLSILYDNNYDNDTSIEGGVKPDILVKGDVYEPLLAKLISRGLFFKFARELIDGKMKIKESFTATEAIINRFKEFLKKNEFSYEADEFKENMEHIRIEIERDVLGNKFSFDHGIKVFLKSDPVTAKALEVLRKELSPDIRQDDRVEENKK
ncbi:MAG: S41 family peptidase [bacterium]|nr:S41 family peptidase [bacterium]